MAKTRTHGRSGQLRIIGGTWRGRKLRFSPAEGLRPTADRTRETLFNWLAPVVAGARCADLFAGTGALGLEALSRGARHCDFVEPAPRTAAELEAHLRALGANDTGRCHRQTAENFLRSTQGAFDLVFIDPPFAQGHVGPACAALARRALLAPGAHIYLETGAAEPLPPLPPNWQVYRQKLSGGVACHLFCIDG